MFTLSFFIFIVSSFAYVLCISRFKTAVKKHDVDGLKKLGLDTKSQFSFQESRKNKSRVMSFFFKKHYLKYPDQSIVKLAHYTYISLMFFYINLAAMFVIMLFPSIN
jgi:hypothetical protein